MRAVCTRGDYYDKAGSAFSIRSNSAGALGSERPLEHAGDQGRSDDSKVPPGLFLRGWSEDMARSLWVCERTTYVHIYIKAVCAFGAWWSNIVLSCRLNHKSRLCVNLSSDKPGSGRDVTRNDWELCYVISHKFTLRWTVVSLKCFEILWM